VSEARLEPVLNTIKVLKDTGTWFEVINLIVPTLSDDEKNYREMMQWLHANIGVENPVHISAFFPSYKLTNLPSTSVDTLNKFRDIAVSEGIQYVYIGNIPDNLNTAKDTVCPNCHNTIIKRQGYSITEFHLDNGKCTFCKYSIKGVWS
jgi:pyruvate formate lyase activating enzyme